MAAPEPRAPRPSQPLTALRPRRRWRHAAWALLLLCTGVGTWHTLKPLPPGVHVAGAYVATPDSALRFLTDVTAQDGAGGMLRQQHIHAATLAAVRDARDFLVMDYFLFNGQGGPKGALQYRDGLAPVSAELIAALRALRAAQPALPILVITDPINDYYRGTAPPMLAALRAQGIEVVVTDLSALRDSNPIYSGVWRTLLAWWLPTRGEGWWPNLLDGAGPGLRAGALLRLPNFKANHRKLLITGDGAGSLVGIVASANPHDASSAHSNVAVQVRGEALRPLLRSELDVARFSGWAGGPIEQFLPPVAMPPSSPGDPRVAVLTEGAIRDELLQRFDAAGAGDQIDVAQFYLADRQVLTALRAAAERGVAVRVLLDPNRDAFGFEKSGVPNRPVAHELVQGSGGRIALRWYRTSGEQFHAKFASVRRGARLWFTAGSANFTRRNIGDLNLEANVAVEADTSSAVATQATTWFQTLWSNAGGIPFTDPAGTWQDGSRLRHWQARLMEATGLSTF
jgi:hypothetical protein